MATRATVLYDAPGPKGRRRNNIYSIITWAIIALLAVWVIAKLNSKDQLTYEKWHPFVQPETWLTYLLPGLWGTLSAAFVSIILAIIMGVLLGLGRLAENKALRVVCGVIVEFFRAIPVLLLMIFAYQLFAIYHVVAPNYLAFWAVTVAPTLYNGSVVAEILRAGIKSLPKGQTEAAQALGMTHPQYMVTILLPQSVAAMLPALISQLVIALKDSALGYQIGYVEIVRSGLQQSAYNLNYLPSLVVVGIVMILINWGLTAVAERVDEQLRAGRARRNIFAKVPHEKRQGIDTKDNANLDWHSEQYKPLPHDMD